MSQRKSPRRRRIIVVLGALLAMAVVFAITIKFWPPAGMMARKIQNKYLSRTVHPAGIDLDAARARLSSLLPAGAAFPLPDANVQVDKQNHRATLCSGDRPIRSYAIALGQNRQGHKLISGDSRTPEGTYYVCTRLARPNYLFLGLNYPNGVDAARAFKDGTISAGERKAIMQAETLKAKPDWETPLGGAIGLHSGSIASDWTGGCIAFDNEAIAELWVATDYWTPVTIHGFEENK